MFVSKYGLCLSNHFSYTMADKKKIIKYYSAETIGTLNYRGVIPEDLEKALNELQNELGRPKKTKEKLMFAAARIGLGLPPITQ